MVSRLSSQRGLGSAAKRMGERVMSRTLERQVNELHIRAAILNKFTERPSSDGGRGVAASGVWGNTSESCFMQQRRFGLFGA